MDDPRAQAGFFFSDPQRVDASSFAGKRKCSQKAISFNSLPIQALKEGHNDDPVVSGHFIQRGVYQAFPTKKEYIYRYQFTSTMLHESGNLTMARSARDEQ